MEEPQDRRSKVEAGKLWARTPIQRTTEEFASVLRSWYHQTLSGQYRSKLVIDFLVFLAIII
jgi:hypothetical protein